AFSLFWGAMVDRFGANRLLAIFLLPVVVGFFIFSQFNGVVAFIFGFIFVGAMQGGNATIPMAFWSESYGTEHIGAIRSLAQTTMVMSSAVSPVLTGYFIDRGVSFAQQMPFYAVVALGLCVFCWFICRRFFRDANSPLAP
ncbi:MAG: MFS transporter, partial [Proteobacteria bacterium]|nr:MFS transporter [Pseudomonadota bacterium]